MPCTLCGTILQVGAETEIIFCTTCGAKIELGVHSYHTEPSSKPRVFCIDCNQALDTEAIGTIFSCNSCGEIICNVCAKVSDNKRYCHKCFESILKPESVIAKKPRTKRTQEKRKTSKRTVKKPTKKSTKKASKSTSKKSTKKTTKKPSKKSSKNSQKQTIKRRVRK